jgi:putative two-component system response regulator
MTTEARPAATPAGDIHTDPDVPERILIADDEALICALLSRILSSSGYSCRTCSSGTDALARLRESQYELLLADIRMPGMPGPELLRQALQCSPDLAVILVTGVAEIDAAVGAIQSGACDYITKPFHLNEVVRSVERALDHRRMRISNRIYEQNLEEEVSCRTRQLAETLAALRETYDSTLQALGTVLDSREADSAGHSHRLMKYAGMIARQMGLPEAQVRSIEQAALLHDIGKIGVPDALLVGSGRRSETEWAVISTHPAIGYRILSGIKDLRDAAEIVLHHRERWDGTGYPCGLKGNQIAIGARVLAVADAVESLTSEQSSQGLSSFEAARHEIARSAGSQLDPLVVEALLRIPLPEFAKAGLESCR